MAPKVFEAPLDSRINEACQRTASSILEFIDIL